MCPNRLRHDFAPQLRRGITADGPWKTYHENGQLRSEGTYKDGQLDGLWKVYDINGQLFREETYKDGKLIDSKQY